MNQLKNNSRRDFIKKASIGGLITLASPGIIIAEEAGKPKKTSLEKDDVILFQGDSITDFGRKKNNKEANNAFALGPGYAFIAASELLYKHPDKNLKIYNRGISGNKVYQLADRWEDDCLSLKPNVLSILVGVNDFWHTLVNNYKGTIDTYRNDYKNLLDRTRQKLPDVKLIIGEPYAVLGVKVVDQKWYPAFNDYRLAAREIAASFNAVFIPYQDVFDKAQKLAPGSYWTADGVHPTAAGCRLMAEAWLQTVKA